MSSGFLPRTIGTRASFSIETMTRAFIGLHSPRPVMPSLVRTSTKIEPVFRGKTSTAVIFRLRKSVAAFSTCGEMCSANRPAVVS